MTRCRWSTELGPSTLVTPSAAYKDSYRALVAEFVAGGEALVPFPLGFPHENFAAMIAQLQAAAVGIGIPPGFVPHSTFWLLQEGEVVGVSNLRHALTDGLRVEGGHIGYGIRPSARGRGCGREILRQTLQEAARLGIESALLTCAKGNAASAAVIAANGGTLENEEYLPARGEVVQRWWVPTRR